MAVLVAVLELGSNAVRCLLARITPGQGFRVLRSERVQTRLGGGAPGTLPRKAVRDTLRAAHDFLERARNGQRPRVVAVATAAVRDAANRERLVGALRREEGVRVRVLSGAQEARLGALAALWGLPVENALVADLGGASLQLTQVRGGRIARTASVPLGVVRMTRRLVRHDPPTPRELRALRAEVRRALLQALLPTRWGDELIGLGGTVRALASIHLRAHPRPRALRHGLRLRQSDVAAIRARLAALPERQRRRIPGLKAERVDTVLAGAIVIEEAMALGGYATLTVSTRGVRDGLLLRATFDAARNAERRSGQIMRPRSRRHPAGQPIFGRSG